MTADISDEQSLVKFLTEEFAYCGCGYYDDAMLVLRELLEFAKRRDDSLKRKDDKFSQITTELDDWLLRSPGLSTWFVWLLDERGFIWHGKRTSDCYITDKGRATLDAINSFWQFDDGS